MTEPNLLAQESSPYLRQHMHNPVRWRPWGEAAFAEARRRDVPVLVSIGYSTCHWCHVMAHESFEHAPTAAVMDEHCICIKVDREEHPEVDEIYMDAVQALTGHGGWPLNAFVDHDGRPFYCATYVPRAQWVQLVRELGRIWRDDRGRIDEAARNILGHLQQDEAAGGAIGDAAWTALDQQLAKTWDPAHPGFAWNPQRAPKFPASTLIPLLLVDGREGHAAMAVATLEAMQDSGLHDRVGGGFHRYSVDRAWRLPHFEKMLYDNAQLIGCYALAAARHQRPDFLRTALNAADYLLRDLRLGDGLAAAEDADDPMGEGSFYAWSPEQLAQVLGAETGARLAQEWDLHPGERETGPHGHPDPVLTHIPHPRGAGLPADPAAAQARRTAWEPLHPRLRAARDARPRPGRDDKVVTDLNGLALEGLALLARWCGDGDRPRLLAAARDLAALMAARHTSAGLLRLAHRPAFVTDYGHAVLGLTAAFDALGDPALIDRAGAIAGEAIDRLRADDGGFYTTPAGRRDLPRRSREGTDNAYPSGQNALALGMVRLWNLTGEGRWRALAEGVFSAGAAVVQQAPSAAPTLLRAWRRARRGVLTAVVAGAPDDPATQALLAACRAWPDPDLAVVPLAACRERGWECLDGRRELTEPQALVCFASACLAPARTPDEVRARLASLA